MITSHLNSLGSQCVVDEEQISNAENVSSRVADSVSHSKAIIGADRALYGRGPMTVKPLEQARHVQILNSPSTQSVSFSTSTRAKPLALKLHPTALQNGPKVKPTYFNFTVGNMHFQLPLNDWHSIKNIKGAKFDLSMVQKFFSQSNGGSGPKEFYKSKRILGSEIAQKLNAPASQLISTPSAWTTAVVVALVGACIITAIGLSLVAVSAASLLGCSAILVGASLATKWVICSIGMALAGAGSAGISVYMNPKSHIKAPSR